MRWAVLFALFSTSPTFAQSPNRLTPEQARDGWILLFDGTSTFGWKAEGEVRVADGAIHLGPKGTGTLTWLSAPPSSATLALEYHGHGEVLQTGAGVKIKTDLASTNANDWNAYLSSQDIAGQRTLVIASLPGKSLTIRSIKLQPQKAKSLFNGTDLTGWKIFPGKKSNVAVKDGAINIQDGPGDLQTEAKFKNFLLQFDAISHGKHLNSGLFFRCRDNEYQNGYEAQINHNFTPEPLKDYVVEDYDPMTNKLLDKKKVKSAAVDFGTGAIYRRIPARVAVAKDGEWFTMTVLAQGNHLATWVNGIQTVDWYDNRPASDNARTGYRAAAGHLSLQGHDPTTNLSFKNFKIAELPE